MALQTKTITDNGSKGHHRFTLKVNEDSTNTSTNKSQGTYAFQISPIQTGWDWSGWGSNISYSGSIGGTTFSGTIPQYNGSSTITLSSGSFEIEHNTDGNKTIAISFSVTDNTGVNYTCGNANASGEMTLTYIPRKTKFTQTNYSANVGDLSKFATVKPASPTFTHSLKLTIGDTFVKYINGNTGEWSDTEIKFPTILKEGTNEMDLYFDAKTDLYSLFTGTDTTGLIELTTYNDNNNLGVSTAFLIIIATSACMPRVASATIYDNNPDTFDLTSDHERMVAGQSLCQLSLTFTPSAAEDTNTTISSLKINGVEYPDAVGTTAFSTNIGTLSTNMIKVELVNSRGVPNTVMIQVNKWVPYVAIDGSVNLHRGSPNTTTGYGFISDMFLWFSSNYYNGSFTEDESGQNEFKFIWRYKKASEEDTSYSEWYILDISKCTIENNIISSPQSGIQLTDNNGNDVAFDYHSAYTIQLKMSDKLTSQTQDEFIYSAAPCFSWSDYNFNVTDTFSFGGTDSRGFYNHYSTPVVVKKQDFETNDGVIKKTIANGLINSAAYFNDNDYVGTDFSEFGERLYLNATTLATKHNNEWIEPTCWADIIYPVGSIYMNVNNTNPSLLFGGTWEQIKGKFLVGVDSSDTDFNTSEKTGGTKNHSHIYGVQYNGFYGTLYTEDKRLIRLYNGEKDTFVESYNTQKSSSEAGNNGAQESRGSTFNPTIYETKTPTTKTSNLPPYMTVYMWKRTA